MLYTKEQVDKAIDLAYKSLLATSAAKEYSPNGSYVPGDFCTHGGGLHKCNTPIPSGEAWNAEHWTETTVAAELAGKANLISPQWRSLPLASRFPAQSYANYYYKTQENIVHVSFCIDSGDKFQNGEVIANLPVGFRPSYNIARCVAGDGISMGSGIITAEIQVYANGNIVLYHCNSDIRWLLGEFTFLAEN